uniref:Uncharacterized protein n=1 Tax=Arundo donax TaxID=35708 RepID=A0A0A8YNJ3_ARUDO
MRAGMGQPACVQVKPFDWLFEINMQGCYHPR